MSNNILNDISKVYLSQVIEKKNDSYLETDMNKRQKNNKKAIEDMKDTEANKSMVRSARKAMGVDEAVDQDSDGDNDFADIRIARMIASGVPKEVAIQKTKDKLYNKKPKKVAKESFSNWRSDLREIADEVDDSNSKQIKEKKIKNKITINPSFKEAVEDLGGELVEMLEIDESELSEKALSQQQQKFMGMVYAVKKGKMKSPSPEVAQAASSMTKSQAKDFAQTKHKGLPKKVEEQSTEKIETPPPTKLSSAEISKNRQLVAIQRKQQQDKLAQLNTGVPLTQSYEYDC